MRDNIVANATIDYSGDQAARTTLASPVHDISFTDLLKQYAYLAQSGATPPDGDSFPVILSAYSLATLLLDPSFKEMFIFEEDHVAIRTGYMGKLLNMRFYVTSNAKAYVDGGLGSTTDVYTATIIGNHALYILGLAGYPDTNSVWTDNSDTNMKAVDWDPNRRPVEIIAKPVGSSGAVDPLNQRGSLAWKMALTPKVANSALIRVLEHTNIMSND